MDFLTELSQSIFTAIIITGVLGYFFLNREERLKKTIEEEFKKRDRFFETQFNYKLKALEDLLAPMVMQFKRSLIALREYDANNTYREAILKKCNTTIRDLLLTKGHLIPSDLSEDAGELIKHYDGWLEEYHQIREIENDPNKPFVFTYNFPKQAEKNFTARYHQYRKEVKLEEELK